MNREMIVFGGLTVLLGTVLFAGLHLEPHEEALLKPQSREMAPINVPPPTSHGPSAVEKERRNPFAPPVEVKPIAQPKPPKPPVDSNAPPPPPPPPPPSTVVKPPTKTITEWSPAEIPVGFAGIFARSGQPPEAHLTAKDGSTMVVHVGDEIKSLGVKIVEIAATDVTVEVGDRRASLRDLIQRNATATPNGANPAPTGGTATPPNVNDAGALLKQLLGGGGFDLAQFKNLSPEQVQTLLKDPEIRKLIEEQVKKAEQQNPPAGTDNRRGPGGNGGQGGNGNRGNRGNRGGGNGRGGEGGANGGADGGEGGANDARPLETELR